jgi:hypothetical protein
MLRTFALVSAAALAVAVLACGTDAVGVESCKQIEAARCQLAPACGVSLLDPPHRDPDVEACTRFYDVACLHGLEASGDPGTIIVNACIAAIKTDVTNGVNGGCNAVLHPETDPACAWLVPAPTPVDAGSDSDAPVDADGAAEAGDGG